MDLWLPTEQDPEFFCLICGAEFLTAPSYESHVPKCAAEYEGEIYRWKMSKRPPAIFESADPEYRDWQQKTGKLL